MNLPYENVIIYTTQNTMYKNIVHFLFSYPNSYLTIKYSKSESVLGNRSLIIFFVKFITQKRSFSTYRGQEIVYHFK